MVEYEKRKEQVIISAIGSDNTGNWPVFRTETMHCMHEFVDNGAENESYLYQKEFKVRGR